MSKDEKPSTPLSIAGLDYFPRQWQAVAAPVGPILVLAGPGSGKTRCLTGRIAFLIQQERADPSRICAITYTNKAAQEIANRVRVGLGVVAENLTLGTIHSLCLKILRPFTEKVNLPPGFGVADEQHQLLALRRLGVYQRDRKGMLTRFGRRRLEGYQLTPNEEQKFQQYQAALRSSRLIDFDDILFLTRQLLQENPAIMANVQGRWDHVLVDEFQDLDFCQYEILKGLADRHKSIFAVGDDEQSIFAWRGADTRIIAHFMRDFGIQSAVMLDINCRCAKPIFETARRILRQGELYPRREITASRDSVFPVEVSGHADDAAEANWLVKHLLEDRTTSGLSRSEYAFLYRKHETGERLEQALIAAGVPCQLSKGRALADNPVMAQVVSSFRIILEPDSELELERLAGLVLSSALVSEILLRPGGSLREKLRNRASQRDTDAKKCWQLLYQLDSLKSLSRSDGNLANLFDAVLSMGIGAYASPFDELLEKLEDPATIPGVAELGTRLLDVQSHFGHVLIVPHGGLEIPIRMMLRKVLPSVRTEYLWSDTNPEAGDLVLCLAPEDHDAERPECFALYGTGRTATLMLFAALQFIESRQYCKAFTEYVAFDTESTDLNTEACEVIELAAVRVRDGKIIGQFETLIQVNRPISTRATAVHGYVDADLIGKPTLAEIWPAFREFIGDSVLVAHHGHQFDVPVLKRLLLPWDGLKEATFFDSLSLAKHLFPTGSLGLEALAIRFGVDTGRSHHALDDTICLVHVFERLQEERLRRARISCLANMLDLIALSLVVEGPQNLDEVAEILFRKGARRAFGRLSNVLVQYEQEAAATNLVCPPVAEIIDRLGGVELQNQTRQEKTPEDRFPEVYSRIKDLLTLSQRGTLEESIRCFLDHLALSRSDGSGVELDRVCLLTFHATKGLEFSRVYVVGVEDFQLPGYYETKDNLEAEIHEARRLLYVAMTRAKDRLCLTYCRERKGKSSGGTMFLSDMGLVQNEVAAIPPAASAS